MSVQGRVGVLGSMLLLACASTPSPTQGTGGGAVASGGMTSNGAGAATAGAAVGGAAAAGSSAGGTTTGGTTGGATAGGSTTGGTTTGGTTTGGASAGGTTTGGTSAGGVGGAGGTAAVAGNSSGGTGGTSKTTFFVTSDTSKTGNLGGLAGADKRCQDLATKAGFGDHTFHAYLSTATVNARDRIGAGPWVNAKGLTVAPNVATLHSAATKGDHTIFIDEAGMPIHGQWDGGPVEHDVLTGSLPDGTVQSGKTCADWTSAAANATAQVGHSDGMGPGMDTSGTYSSWNSAHENGSCADTAPKGGAGRLYCFAIN